MFRCFPAISPLVTALILAVWLAGCASVRGYRISPQTTLLDVHGAAHQPLPGDDVVRVLIFITTDCPIANSYAPEINSLVMEYQPRGVAFFVVHVDRNLSMDQARQHADEFAYRCTVLMDQKHELVKIVGATVTPEAAVIAPDGRMVYRGRIDDRYIDFGKKRFEPAHRDLRAALDAVLTGREVAKARTRAIGCYISDV